MFNSPIIDVALTLSFTYFILSLTVTTINEYVSSTWRGGKRGTYLKDAISNLFFDDHWKALAVKIYESENIKALKSKNNGSLPSYIPAASFAQALIEQFKAGDFELIDMDKIKDVLLNADKYENTGIEGAVRKVLINFYERAQGDLQLFQKQIESFYNDAMDRGAGIYKRHMQVMVLFIGFVTAAALNADTIGMARSLWANPSALKQTADNIQRTVKQINTQSGGNMAGKTVSFDNDNSKVTVTTDSISKDTTHKAGVNAIIHNLNSNVIYLKNTGVPLGWSKENMPATGDKIPNKDIIISWLIKFAGIVLTAFALSLGAPFWFDLLNKIINIRGTGKKPDDIPSHSQASSKTA